MKGLLPKQSLAAGTLFPSPLRCGRPAEDGYGSSRVPRFQTAQMPFGPFFFVEWVPNRAWKSRSGKMVPSSSGTEGRKHIGNGQ